MSANTARRDELIAALREYQELANRFDMKAAMTYCSENPTIAIDGRVTTGYDGVFEIHEGDRGSRLIVDFTDFVLEDDGNTLGCYFHAESEIERVLGIRGIARWNRITFLGNRIHYWDIDKPAEEELARRRPVVRPFFEWAEEKHPALMERLRSGPNFHSGSAAVELANLWREEQGVLA